MTDARRFQRNLQAEIDGASLYAALADGEESPVVAEVYRRLAETERRHAELWRTRLREAGVDVAEPRPSRRARILAALARRFGNDLVLPVITGNEQADRSAYDAQADAVAAGLPADERSHARILAAVADRRGTGADASAIARVEGRHRSRSGNALRAAVLGANDGLVSNLSLVMGVVGASLSSRQILITGLAGLLAGSCSMAMGEWVSVTSARELYEREIAVERDELEAAPEEEREELALIYQSKGLSPEQAAAVADRLMADDAAALDTLVREELGVDPDELGGSAWQAAGASFLLFCIGAIPPVAPFAFLDGTTAVVASLALSALALFGIGAAITLLTGRSVWRSGARQLLIGLGAAGVTYVVGSLVGAAV